MEKIKKVALDPRMGKIERWVKMKKMKEDEKDEGRYWLAPRRGASGGGQILSRRSSGVDETDAAKGEKDISLPKDKKDEKDEKMKKMKKTLVVPRMKKIKKIKKMKKMKKILPGPRIKKMKKMKR